MSVSRTEISNGTTPERALGPDHPHTLTYRNNLARAYLATGQTTDVDGLDSLSPEIRQLWGPLLAAAVATATGRADQHTTWALDTRLDHLATYPGWATLTVVVRRIITGERNPELLAGLDTIDTTITTALLKRLDDTGRGAKRWWRRRR